MKKNMVKIILPAFIMAYYATPAYAYIDPSTTAMLTQIVAGIFISLCVAVGIYRQKVILFFKNLSVRHVQWKIDKQNRKTDNKK